MTNRTKPRTMISTKTTHNHRSIRFHIKAVDDSWIQCVHFYNGMVLWNFW